MAGLDLAAIHTALANQIRGNIATGYNVAAFPDAGVPVPRIEVWPADPYVAYFGTFGANGAADVGLELRITPVAANGESFFKLGAALCSAGTGHGTSIVDAIHDDMTLGGTVAAARALTARWDVENEEFVIPVEITLMKTGAKV